MDRPTTRPRATASSPPPTPASRSRSRRSTPTRRRSSSVTRPGDHRAPRGRHEGARHAADHHGPLRRRRVHAAAARPRLRRGRRRDQLGADRGRPRRAAHAGQVDVPRAQEPGQPHSARSASRTSSGTTRSPTGSPRSARASSTSATTSPRRAGSSGTACSRTSSPATRTTWVDYKNDDRAPLLFISGSEDHLMPPKIQQSQRQALQVRHDHRGQGVRGPAPAAREGRLGGGRRLRARLGACATRRSRRRRDGGPDHAHRRADGPDRGRRLAAADRPDVRPARPELPLRLGHGLAQAGRARDRGRASSGRSTRSLLTPRPPRRQPRRRRPRAAARRPGPSSRPRRAPAGSAAARAGSRRGRRRGSRRRASPRSRSPRRRAATARRSAARSSGDVIGFALRWDGQEHGVALDLGRHRALRRRARGRRAGCDVDIALLHLGGVRFPITGPLRYTMTARDAVELCGLVAPARRDPDPLRGLGALPRGPRRDRARVRARARRGPAVAALAPDRRGGRGRSARRHARVAQEYQRIRGISHPTTYLPRTQLCET